MRVKRFSHQHLFVHVAFNRKKICVAYYWLERKRRGIRMLAAASEALAGTVWVAWLRRAAVCRQVSVCHACTETPVLVAMTVTTWNLFTFIPTRQRQVEQRNIPISNYVLSNYSPGIIEIP